jgi:hypothetical protein
MQGLLDVEDIILSSLGGVLVLERLPSGTYLPWLCRQQGSPIYRHDPGCGLGLYVLPLTFTGYEVLSSLSLSLSLALSLCVCLLLSLSYSMYTYTTKPLGR